MGSETIEDFLIFLRGALQDLEIARDDLDQADQETQDILHRLELGDDDYYTRGALTKKLVEVRQKRRDAKYIIAVYEPIEKELQNNKAIKNGLEKILGLVRKAEEKNNPENLYYNNRTTVVHDVLEGRKK